ncbi:MAG: CpaF family protein [Coriobacteriia bacterium]|nr:CpaF family protein [Coriobacteriia bacterium]
MSLTDRLTTGTLGSADELAATGVEVNSAKDSVVRHLHYLLIEEMGAELTDREADELELRDRIERRLGEYLAEDTTPLSATERRKIITDVIDNILGYGPIQEYLDDPEITEVMVNNASTIYIERLGKIYPASGRFIDEAHLLRIIDKIVAQVGRRIDESSAMVDARLPDGSRVNAVVHPLAINGPMLTIRKFSRDPFTVDDLIRFGTLSRQTTQFLQACVLGKLNILISGGTGTGKTTLLNVVSAYIPDDERIVTIEDAAELRLHQQHVLRLESRPPNIEGKGQVTIRDLVRNSLRMRPDRIIVGEVRGAEALDMLQAMNTGHEGSLSTVHANSPRDALSRIETMVLMSGYDLPVRAIREQSSAALNVVIHLSRLRDGTRRITQVAEIETMEGDTIVMQDIYSFDYSMGVSEDGHYLGYLKPTGLRPKFAERLEYMGIEMPAEMFALGQSSGQ